MFITTPEQDFILSVLQKTKVMRTDQAVRLLSAPSFSRSAVYTERCLDQLRHIRKIKWKSADIFTLPIMCMEPVDEDMLSAIDIMLDMTNSEITELSRASPPYKLSFLVERDKKIGSFTVCVVSSDTDAVTADMLSSAQADKRTVIFLLSELSQKESVKTSLPHLFAVRDGGRYRYFQGVVDTLQ